MTNIVPKFESCPFIFLTKNNDLVSEVLLFADEWNAETAFFNAQTSGSTGIPKTVRLNKQYALQSVVNSNAFFHFERMERMGLCLSPGTIGGKMQVLRALAYHVELVVLDNERNPLKKLEQKLDFLTLVPLQLQTILEESPEKIALCRTILVGGAPVSKALRMKLRSFSTQFFESYGMTETYSHVAVRNLQNDTPEFQALDGIRFSTEDGNLVIHAPGLGLPHLITRDAVILKDESHFELLGRSDFAINSGGYKFHPEALERKLESLIDVNYFIIGEPDPLLGECVTLYLETEYTPEKERAIRAICESCFEKYEKPKKICLLPRFIQTPSGKINRLASQKSFLEP